MTSYLDGHTNAFDRNVNSSSATTTTATPKTPIDYRIKANHDLAPRFVFECAIKLNMKPLTSATAAIILHRFNREIESENYDDFVSGFDMGDTSVRLYWTTETFNFSWLLRPRCIWPENSKMIQWKSVTSSMSHTSRCIEVSDCFEVWAHYLVWNPFFNWPLPFIRFAAIGIGRWILGHSRCHRSSRTAHHSNAEIRFEHRSSAQIYASLHQNPAGMVQSDRVECVPNCQNSRSVSARFPPQSSHSRLQGIPCGRVLSIGCIWNVRRSSAAHRRFRRINHLVQHLLQRFDKG